jgi:hypothetical protein
MKSRLDRIETRLQAFIESSLQFMPAANKQDALAHQMVAAIERTVIQEANGVMLAPSMMTIRLNPHDLSIWNTRQGLVDSLASILEEAAREAGVVFTSPPVVRLQGDPSLAQDHFEIDASSRESKVEETASFTLQAEKPVEKLQNNDGRPNGAFLILNGVTIPLRLPVINIGRRQDNQVIIDDPRVSRTHTQLRAIHGHYVLFDLNSTGGTLVNGIRVSQQVLNPGDVISLAGVPLIYGEENSPPPPPRRDLRTGRLEIRHDPPHH